MNCFSCFLAVTELSRSWFLSLSTIYHSTEFGGFYHPPPSPPSLSFNSISRTPWRAGTAMWVSQGRGATFTWRHLHVALVLVNSDWLRTNNGVEHFSFVSSFASRGVANFTLKSLVECPAGRLESRKYSWLIHSSQQSIAWREMSKVKSHQGCRRVDT